VSPQEAAKHLIGKKNIMILTGAGLSAASGIPTFRGAKGFWTSKGSYAGYSEPE
jgi:NAD-dependent SIR2 family protein deacetylase